MCTAEVTVKIKMSTSSFVDLPAVSGVIAVDADPAVADMHAVTDVHVHSLVHAVVS